MIVRLVCMGLLVLSGLPAEDVYQRPRQAEPNRDYDVLHYKITLRFDEDRRAFAGNTVISLKPLRDGFESLSLDAETFQVSEVRDGSGNALRFEQPKGRIVVQLGRKYAYEDQLVVTVFYHAENVSVDPERYGMPKGYGLGLSFKKETQEHPQLLHSLSFPEGARHWFPCFDHPSDKATQELIATVKSPNQVISNGEVVSVQEDRSRGETTFHWRQQQAHSTYLFVVAAGPFVKIAETASKLPISYWVYPKDASSARRVFRKTPEIIGFFEREFGAPFPWPKYDQITIPDFGGGAESTTATVIGDNLIRDEKAEKDFPSHWLIAHEAAHQWWGNLLTMRDWSHTWLNESFATYSEYLFSAHSLGPEEGALNLRSKKDRYLQEARQRYQRPIVFDRWNVPNDNFDRHTYEKGAVVLAMLRWQLGDEPFRRTIAHYLRKHAFQSVDTHDFQSAIRETTGQSMDWFFEQWIYQAGHPILEVCYDWAPEDKQVKLTVVQRQEVPGRVPLFRFPVLIGITTPSGKQVHAIQVHERIASFHLPCAEKPLLVRFDDGDRLLKELRFPKDTSELLFQLAHDDAIGRMDAATELRTSAHHPDVRAALRKAAEGDSFWAVRREAILALRGSPGLDSAYLRDRTTDASSAVRVAALGSLCDVADNNTTSFLLSRFQAEDSYLAQAQALRALGRCGGPESRSLLKEATRMQSPNQVLREAALAALREMVR